MRVGRHSVNEDRITSLSFTRSDLRSHQATIPRIIQNLEKLSVLAVPTNCTSVPKEISQLKFLAHLTLGFPEEPDNYEPAEFAALLSLSIGKRGELHSGVVAWLAASSFRVLSTLKFTVQTMAGQTKDLSDLTTVLLANPSFQRIIKLTVEEEFIRSFAIESIPKLLLETLPQATPHLVELLFDARHSTIDGSLQCIARRLEKRDYHPSLLSTLSLSLERLRIAHKPACAKQKKAMVLILKHFPRLCEIPDEFLYWDEYARRRNLVSSGTQPQWW